MRDDSLTRKDTLKKATPPSDPLTASYKQGKRTTVTTGNENKKSLFNGDKPFDPCLMLVQAERKAKQGKRKAPRLDPFMIRQAKLKAAKGE